MAIVYRSVKGSSLTADEVDNNFEELYNSIYDDTPVLYKNGSRAMTGALDLYQGRLIDKLIKINSGGAATTGAGSGIEIEENGVIVGHVKTETRDYWTIKPPGFDYSLNIGKNGTNKVSIWVTDPISADDIDLVFAAQNLGVISIGGSVTVNSAGLLTASSGANFSGTINYNSLTASRVPVLDASKNLISSGVTSAQLEIGVSLYGTATGTDTYTSALVIAAYQEGRSVFIKFANTNTGASTININTLGAKSIVKNGSSALVGGEINAEQIIHLMYDGTNFQII